MNTLDYSYLYGETLLDTYHFVELFIACMEYKDGVIDVDKNFSYAELPFDYFERINDCMYNVDGEDINIVAKMAPIINVDLYYNNEKKWRKSLREAFKEYFEDNIGYTIDINQKRMVNIIGIPTYRVFDIIKKYDNDMVDSMLYLTSYIKEEKEEDIVKLKRLIDSTGGVNQFNGYSE